MKHILVLSLVCIIFSVIGEIQAAMLNFEVDANGNTIAAPTDPPYVSLTTQYEDWGIIFDSTTKVNSRSSTNDLNTPPNALVVDHNEDLVMLDAYFVDPNNSSIDGTVTWVEFFQDGGAQSGGGTFLAYNIDGDVVIQQSFNQSRHTFHWDYAGGIHRIYVGLCYDGIDDLAFSEVTPVPEPAMVTLLAAGAVALLRRRSGQVLRRRKV
jgi:MYXO-CTERM domain-containing protein